MAKIEYPKYKGKSYTSFGVESGDVPDGSTRVLLIDPLYDSPESIGRGFFIFF